MASTLSPSQHLSFHWSHHWFGGQVSAVFPSEADARGDPPESAGSPTQWGLISSSHLLCLITHPILMCYRLECHLCYFILGFLAQPCHVQKAFSFPALLLDLAQICGKRGEDGGILVFFFLSFGYFFVSSKDFSGERRSVSVCCEWLAVNRRQVVVTVPGQLGIAHLLSYLLVTRILSPPPFHLPIVQLLSLVF